MPISVMFCDEPFTFIYDYHWYYTSTHEDEYTSTGTIVDNWYDVTSSMAQNQSKIDLIDDLEIQLQLPNFDLSGPSLFRSFVYEYSCSSNNQRSVRTVHKLSHM